MFWNHTKDRVLNEELYALKLYMLSINTTFSFCFQPKQKKSNWRQKSKEMRETLKYSRQVKKLQEEGGNLADLPPPPVSDTSDYKQCPHCGRKFSEGAAERHIPKCKTRKENEALKKGSQPSRARRR